MTVLTTKKESKNLNIKCSLNKDYPPGAFLATGTLFYSNNEKKSYSIYKW